jgi:hypothetical protein
VFLGGGFEAVGGCSTMYEAMADRVGASTNSSVLLQAAFNVKRQANAVKVKIDASRKWRTGKAVSGAGFVLAAGQREALCPAQLAVPAQFAPGRQPPLEQSSACGPAVLPACPLP